MENEWVACLIVFWVFVFMVAMTIYTKKHREKLRELKDKKQEFESVVTALKYLKLWK